MTAPLEAGATHERVTEALPDTPDTDVGEEGAVAGITAVEAGDAADVPTELVAVTVKV